MKYILTLWLALPVLGYIAGYSVASEQQTDRRKGANATYTDCSSPQHEGDKTIGYLVKRTQGAEAIDGGLTLVCEYHSKQ